MALIRLGEAYASHQGISLTTLGRKAANHGLFFVRLKGGCDVTTRREMSVKQYLSEHWPAGLEWPADIPRPERTANGKGAAA